MYEIIVLLVAVVAVGAALAQYNQPRNSGRDAAILSEARYQAGDGAFGAAYLQEDGVEFKEEADTDGNRKGSYSYVGPDGQRRTVHYTAGKHGFVATGDHLPRAPPAPVPVAPQPQYQPQPQYNPAPQQYSAPAHQQHYNPAPQHYHQPAPQYHQHAAPQQRYYEEPTTQPPHRFYPPGKLSLSRTPGGYSYTFNKE
ncbi:hypothetical protein J437_LFUL001069 [Ladona fulva]|uniref:Uncharacterized protein n=1 Tax=Ladona fulva TaxID=123851 RepID=A0A8K0K7J6_LADFU|nr:hypothetical protein J437_LFUL001069 [Ladona fulva]